MVIPLQQGQPSRILKAWAADYNRYIEQIRQEDCGGWTPTNSVDTSNHLGGTATDLNWNSHPFRVRGTFNNDQMAVLREMLDFYEGTVFWAGDWNDPIDEMHHQMGYDTFQNPHTQDFINRKIGGDGFSAFRKVPAVPRKPMKPGPDGTYWADVSHYQGNPVDDTYPHPVFAFRTNAGDEEDTLGAENARRALDMLGRGKLQAVIAYYFFRPGEMNCDLHRQVLEKSGLWNHPRTVTMIDVEDAGGQIRGDQSSEVNDEVQRVRGWYSNYARAIGYWNPNANPGLWQNRPGLNLVIPQYGKAPGDLSSVKNQAIVANEAFAHQFTSTATDCAPWTGHNVDVNWSPYNIDELLQLFGLTGGTPEAPATPPSVVVPREASRSIYAQDMIPLAIDDLIRGLDGMMHESRVEKRAEYGDPEMIEWIKAVAENRAPKPEPDWAAEWAQRVLDRIDKESGK